MNAVVKLFSEVSKRPHFETARDFVLWALNADDCEVDMNQKIKLAAALLAAEAKQPPVSVSTPLPEKFRPRTI